MSDEEDEKPKRVLKTTEVKINDSMDVIQKRAKDVDAFLAKSNAKDALITAIADPPLGSKSEPAKELNFKTVIKALAAVKETDVPKMLEEVQKAHGGAGVDNVMKYVCRGLAEAEACGILLKWHGAVVDKQGLGPIVRVMTDRRGV